MQRGWYWTTGTSAFQRYHPSILIQPSSLCCLLPSQAMELCPDPEWLLLQILCWKVRSCPCRQRAREPVPMVSPHPEMGLRVCGRTN